MCNFGSIENVSSLKCFNLFLELKCLETLKIMNEIFIQLIDCSVGYYLFKVNNRNAKVICKIPSKVTKKTLQNDVNDEVLVSLLLNMNRFYTFLGVSIIEFEKTKMG